MGNSNGVGCMVLQGNCLGGLGIPDITETQKHVLKFYSFLMFLYKQMFKLMGKAPSSLSRLKVSVHQVGSSRFDDPG